MMNNARLGVGVQGIGVAEAAMQHALAYADGPPARATPLAGKAAPSQIMPMCAGCWPR